jgi:hypothetical protein
MKSKNILYITTLFFVISAFNSPAENTKNQINSDSKTEYLKAEIKLLEKEKINLKNQKKISEAGHNNPYDMIEDFLIAENSRDFDYIFGFFSSYIRRYYGHTRPTYYSLRNLYQKAWKVNSYSKNTLLDIDEINNNVFLVKIQYKWRKYNSTKLNSKQDLLKFVLDEDDRIIEVYSIN